jgi:DNA-binding GntR family transcriptional regulator
LIDRDLTDFISGSVPSVWALELLLFMRGHPDQTWSRQALVRELRGSETVVQNAVSVFEASGLVRCEGGDCTYQPASPALAELCDGLARLYRERPVAVINAITRSRSSSLESFADAFRLKEPDE